MILKITVEGFYSKDDRVQVEQALIDRLVLDVEKKLKFS